VPHRYAVLWETFTDQPARPVGLVVEQDDHVLVEARDDLCIPTRYDAPFTVAGPDMTTIQYTPRDPQYFDQVIVDLSRAFSITDYQMVGEATEGVILRLLNEHVLRPLREKHVVSYYHNQHKYPVVQRYRETHYADTAAAHGETGEESAMETVDDLVAV
jgi:hypothetical protein